MIMIDEKFEFDGIEYVPLNDVIEEDYNDLLFGYVVNASGERFKAYYSHEHLKADKWDAPLYIQPCLPRPAQLL